MKLKKRLSILATTLLLQMVFFATDASAQYKDINTISISLKTILKNLGVHAADIVSIIVGIIAIVMLLPTKNGSGIFMAFVIIEFCRMFFT